MRTYLIIAGLAVALSTVALASATESHLPVEDQAALIRADAQALELAEEEFRTLTARGALGDTETQDYRAWLDQLRAGLAHRCRNLQRETGDSLPGDLPCGPLTDGQLSTPGIDLGREATRGEHTGSLDAELDSSLGQFDELLLREQERVKAAAPHTGAGTGAGQRAGDVSGTGQGGGAGSASGEPVDGDTADGTVADSGETGTSGSTDTRRGGESRQGTAGQPGGSVSTTVPADIPDGSDDDVVARQLREAAEKETDPELREKLWDEYRKYKQGIR